MKGKSHPHATRKARRVQGFQVLEDECIWMKAGVVNYRLCDNAYDCYHCPFDTAMRKAMGVDASLESENIAPRWADHLRRTYRGAERPCRHALTGRIEVPKICPLNYECYHCAYDQMLDDMDLTEDPGAPVYRHVSGYRMADGHYYHVGHNWLRFEHGGRVRTGLDDFAARLFGVPDRLELPPLGETVRQNEPSWAFHRNGHRAGLLSAATGTVVAVNRKASDQPDMVHADPYHHGWLMILEPTAPKRNLRGLYYGEESDRWMENEVRTLLGMVGEPYEEMAATGAEPLPDIFGALPGMDWKQLTRTFLRTEAF